MGPSVNFEKYFPFISGVQKSVRGLVEIFIDWKKISFRYLQNISIKYLYLFTVFIFRDRDILEAIVAPILILFVRT